MIGPLKFIESFSACYCITQVINYPMTLNIISDYTQQVKHRIKLHAVSNYMPYQIVHTVNMRIKKDECG